MTYVHRMKLALLLLGWLVLAMPFVAVFAVAGAVSWE